MALAEKLKSSEDSDSKSGQGLRTRELGDGYLAGKQSRSLAKTRGPEYFFLISA